MDGIKIAAVGTYHPITSRDNSYYFNKFENKKMLSEIFEKVGREKRFVINDENENSLTMAITASKRALENHNITGNDIDIIIFSSTTLEFLSPTNALILHAQLGVKKECICFDINANCLGMFVALEQASILLGSKESYQRALVIGSDYLSKIGDEKTPIPSTIVGDAAAAIILEKTPEKSGMIDRLYQTDSSFKDTIVYPPQGLSQSHKDDKIHWSPFSGVESVEFAAEALQQLLKNNNLKIDDISCFLLSQFTKSNIDILQEKLELPTEKIEYIGDQYGYTGVSSFFLAYKSRLEKGLLKKDDIIVFWTLGAGYQAGVMLWKL
ncbi:ketoacyl-ACP synthase III [Acinetobacter sichuanensis]|uniref:ketoacyl-ACP synthase III n=1 Tax=Acinetobacter sichuanensis TaxID=2136183 RepID=UPI00280C5785|nr:ketoacyl-ACP synthase III [Acinetobacter sichuanensis]MDQ9021199.1 ketoacyl-ACP synthase III [Acinetobacter sichuanensis]